MLDSHLAELYEVETKRLKEAVRRNEKRFPQDFMFELTRKEFDSLRTQFATLKTGRILNSYKAIEANIAIRTFVLIRQHASDYKE